MCMFLTVTIIGIDLEYITMLICFLQVMHREIRAKGHNMAVQTYFKT